MFANWEFGLRGKPLAYVADWKVSLREGENHEVKDHSTEVCQKLLATSCPATGEIVLYILLLLIIPTNEEFLKTVGRN